MKEVSIRLAGVADAESIAGIYNHYVLHSTATFDTDAKSVEDRERWITERGPEHPVVVATDADDAVIGWGALSPYSPRPAWGHTVEVAVYVSPERLARGIGPLLLADLVERARTVGHHALVSRIVSENGPSIRMAERAGFSRVGTLREVGRKFDRWLDVVVFELLLHEHKG